MASGALTSDHQALHTGKRDFARARLNLPARLVTFSGTSDCVLIDLSRSGAKFGASESPRIGSMVVIEGLPIELFGTVKWSAPGLFGFELETPLSLERVVALRHYADEEAARQEEAQLAYARDWVRGVV